MGKWQMWLMAGVAMVALTGCGHSAVTAPATFKAGTKATAKVAAPAAKQPAASTKPSTSAPKATPAPAKTPAPAAAADTGSIALTLNVTGNATVASLGVTRAEDVLVLLVVNPGDDPASATANLLAPVLVNTRTHQGGQVVLNDDLPIRAPLLA